MSSSAAAAAEPPLACPSGTTQRRLFYADEYWCARPDGTKHGPYRNANDPSREEGAFRDGKRHGWWRRWANGVLVDERRYDRDREDGPVRTWSRAGVLLSSGMMSRGREVGLWRRWHENGRPQERGRYARGKQVGLWRAWHASGRRHLIVHYRRGHSDSDRQEWDEDGELVEAGRYRGDAREGPWIVSQDQTMVGRGRYVRDRREGRWAFTFEGRRTAVGSYRRGRREGAWTFYDFYGKRVEARGRYHRGHREGTWVVREERQVAIAPCRKGRLHGRLVWRRHWGDAEHEIVAHYRDGSLEGWWTDHTPPGTRAPPVERGFYRFGQRVSGNAFDVAEVLSLPDGYWPNHFCEEGRFESIQVFDDLPVGEDEDGGA